LYRGCYVGAAEPAKRKLGELYATIASNFSAPLLLKWRTVIKLRFDKGFKSLKARVKKYGASFKESKRK
jgi:hypothetical protein